MNSTLRSRDRINFRSLVTALCLTLTLVSFAGLDPAAAQETADQNADCYWAGCGSDSYNSNTSAAGG